MGAGQDSGSTDEAYVAAGVTMVLEANQVWTKADMIMKVKE